MVVLLAGCMDSAPMDLTDLPRCAEMKSCGAAILGPGDSLIACGDGAELAAVCAAPRSPTDVMPQRTECRVAVDDPCVCRYGADGVVTALCH